MNDQELKQWAQHFLELNKEVDAMTPDEKLEWALDMAKRDPKMDSPEYIVLKKVIEDRHRKIPN